MNQLNCNTGYAMQGLPEEVVYISTQNSSKQKIKIKEMNKKISELKKYIFTIRYHENGTCSFGTIHLWANNLIHANDLFKRLYCPDRCSDTPEPHFEVISVTESTSLV